MSFVCGQIREVKSAAWALLAIMLLASSAFAQTPPTGSSRNVRDNFPSSVTLMGKQTLDEQDPSTFVFSRFKYPSLSRVQDNWDSHPQGDDAFLIFLRKVANVAISAKPFNERVISVDDFSKIYERPFLFMTGEGEFQFSAKQAETLAEYFRRGGFLYGDDCVISGVSDVFYQAFLREMRKVVPGVVMTPVPPDHEIYRCFYDIPGGRSPFMQGNPRDPDMALFLDNRLVAFLTAGDIHCGWVGYWGDPGAEKCFQMGTNIVIYALTH